MAARIIGEKNLNLDGAVSARVYIGHFGVSRSLMGIQAMFTLDKDEVAQILGEDKSVEET